MQLRTLAVSLIGVFVVLATLAVFPQTARAANVTFSGTVSYSGTHAGNTLYVAVLDTSLAEEDVAILVIETYTPGTPPFSQPYSLTFDNTGVGSHVFVVALLDVDDSGLEEVSGIDIFGWYNGTTDPFAVSSAASLSGLNFALPRAELRGTLTFAPDQIDARISLVPTVLACSQDAFRPDYDITSAGPYASNGIYPGTYCVRAPSTWGRVKSVYRSEAP